MKKAIFSISICLLLVVAQHHLLNPVSPIPLAVSKTIPNTPLTFSPDFLWGVTTAAYQIEGGIKNDWSHAGVDAKHAVEHQKYWQKDIQDMKKMGLKSYRFSLSWARIEPSPGKWDEEAILFYVRLVKSLKKENIEPLVSLWHFTQPQWFAEKGGWENPENTQYYIRFIEKVIPYLSEDVDYWITVNEPMVYAIMAYFKGEWPPYIHSYTRWTKVFKHLLQAHAMGYHTIHQLDTDAKVSLAKNIAILEPANPQNPFDHLSQKIFHHLFNESVWQAIQDGKLSISFPFYIGLREPLLKDSLDWIALHYYSRYFITATGKLLNRPGVSASYFHRDSYPEGLLRAIQMGYTYARPRNLPIMITENGVEDATDASRSRYLQDHIAQVWLAQQAGIPVQGYYHWTFMDNFEWVAGFTPKFGLLDRHRHWKLSAKTYQTIINHGIQSDLSKADELDLQSLKKH